MIFLYLKGHQLSLFHQGGLCTGSEPVPHLEPVFRILTVKQLALRQENQFENITNTGLEIRTAYVMGWQWPDGEETM